MIRAVLFDLDETLIDRDASWQAFARRLPWTPDASMTAILATINAADAGGYRAKDEMFATLARDLPLATPTDGPSLEAFWRREFPSCCVARDGALTTLAALRARGLCLAIVSNGRTEMQSTKIATLGFGRLVDTVVISGTVGVKKPDRRIFEHALTALGVAAEEAIFVGDHPTLDVVGPARIGLRTAWLRLGRDWPAELPPPTWTIAGLVESLNLVGT